MPFGFVKQSTYDALAIQQRGDAQLIDKMTNDRHTLRVEIESLREAAYGADRTAAMYKKLYEGATKALSGIAALETPGCAHVGKRMARIARAELPVLHHEAGSPRPVGNGAEQHSEARV